LAELRRAVGVPVDGPTKATVKAWIKKENSGNTLADTPMQGSAA
jgi:hypothetical protein